MDHSLVVMKGFHNSGKPSAMVHRVTQDGWVTMKSADKKNGPLGDEMATNLGFLVWSTP